MRRAVAFLAAGAFLAAAACRDRPGPPAEAAATTTPATAATYVGSTTCAGCHDAEAALWKDSDHALAMQPATGATVLGDFRNRRVTVHGVTSTFCASRH